MGNRSAGDRAGEVVYEWHLGAEITRGGVTGEPRVTSESRGDLCRRIEAAITDAVADATADLRADSARWQDRVRVLEERLARVREVVR